MRWFRRKRSLGWYNPRFQFSLLIDGVDPLVGCGPYWVQRGTFTLQYPDIDTPGLILDFTPEPLSDPNPDPWPVRVTVNTRGFPTPQIATVS